jgi:hypothetical protein
MLTVKPNVGGKSEKGAVGKLLDDLCSKQYKQKINIHDIDKLLKPHGVRDIVEFTDNDDDFLRLYIFDSFTLGVTYYYSSYDGNKGFSVVSDPVVKSTTTYIVDSYRSDSDSVWLKAKVSK